MIPRKSHVGASTIKGALRHGKFCHLEELPKADLIVAGSVDVSKDGVRIGKGGGYSEIEYGILREIGAAKEETAISTTVHDVQIVNEAPREQHDLAVDAIMTPTKTVRVKRRHKQPEGIFWEKITDHHLLDIPILLELKRTIKK